jgi:superfamily II DNA or RNA helicase
LVVVPTKALKGQTVSKFLTLGILPKFGIVSDQVRTPIVGVLDHRIQEESQLEIFDRCNVVVAVVNSIGSGSSIPFLGRAAERCSHLILDEAHHVAAASWTRLKTAFKGKPILQFTATPFREDRSPLGGKAIYNYPLSKAQVDGYFKPIKFVGVFEVEQQSADESIASKAVNQLRDDLSNGWNHRLLARCQRIERAREVLAIYQRIAGDLNPVLVHSQAGRVDDQIEALKSGESKIVVTVNMLAEGFDLPSLKVAAIHDTFKSLAVTLQFAGRFPRVGDGRIGEPTIVANTGEEDVSKALEGLYDEDANWDQLLSNRSFEKIAERLRFEEFNRTCQDLFDGEVSEETIAAKRSASSLNFRFNTVGYRNAKEFNPYGLRDGLETNHRLVRSWQVLQSNAAFYVTRLVEKPRFTNNKRLEDSTYNLYVLYWDQDRELLHIGSSAPSTNCHQQLAKSVSGDSVERMMGELPYRVFTKIQSLMLQQVGLLSLGGARNHRYSMFTGIDVKDAIERIGSSDSTKSNFFGTGFKGGGPVGLGCSSKGKIWSRDNGTLDSWIEWCDDVGTDLLDDSADTDNLINNVLVALKLDALPADREPWFLEWPERLYRYAERALSIRVDEHDEPFHRWEIRLADYLPEQNEIVFQICHTEQLVDASKYKILLNGARGAGIQVEHIDGPELVLLIGKKDENMCDFFYDYPPILSFTDHSALEGNSFVDPKEASQPYNLDLCETKDWSDTNIRSESHWKDQTWKDDSIQAQAMRWCVDEGFEIVFDDDGANEIADIIAIKEQGDGLVLRMLHCKYSDTDKAGARTKDVVEVSSQAVKNHYWFWSLTNLKNRMTKRHHERQQKGASRYFHGSHGELLKYARLSEIRPKFEKEVIIVQPGISKGAMSEKMNSILASADSFLSVRVGCKLKVWCSE